MITLALAKKDVQGATAYLGARLERWQLAMRDALARSRSAARYSPAEFGPFLLDGDVVVRSRWLEASYASLLELRTELLDAMRIEEGVRAMHAIEPVLRAIEAELDSRLPSEEQSKSRPA